MGIFLHDEGNGCVEECPMTYRHQVITLSYKLRCNKIDEISIAVE
jgi:hypothetical protein